MSLIPTLVQELLKIFVGGPGPPGWNRVKSLHQGDLEYLKRHEYKSSKMITSPKYETRQEYFNLLMARVGG